MGTDFKSVTETLADLYYWDIYYQSARGFWGNGMSDKEAREYADYMCEQRKLDRTVGPRFGPGYAELNMIHRADERKERCSIPGKRPGKWISKTQSQIS